MALPGARPKSTSVCRLAVAEVTTGAAVVSAAGLVAALKCAVRSEIVLVKPVYAGVLRYCDGSSGEQLVTVDVALPAASRAGGPGRKMSVRTSVACGGTGCCAPFGAAAAIAGTMANAAPMPSAATTFRVLPIAQPICPALHAACGGQPRPRPGGMSARARLGTRGRGARSRRCGRVRAGRAGGGRAGLPRRLGAAGVPPERRRDARRARQRREVPPQHRADGPGPLPHLLLLRALAHRSHHAARRTWPRHARRARAPGR